jgi:hypothetical protein
MVVLGRRSTGAWKRRGMDIKGLPYDNEDAPAEIMRRDLRAIREDLHCTAVMLTGATPWKLGRAARYALEAGLDVHIRPSLPDRPRRQVLAHLAETAAAAEELRARHPGRVTLLVA